MATQYHNAATATPTASASSSAVAKGGEITPRPRFALTANLHLFSRPWLSPARQDLLYSPHFFVPHERRHLSTHAAQRGARCLGFFTARDTRRVLESSRYRLSSADRGTTMPSENARLLSISPWPVSSATAVASRTDRHGWVQQQQTGLADSESWTTL